MRSRPTATKQPIQRSLLRGAPHGAGVSFRPGAVRPGRRPVPTFTGTRAEVAVDRLLQRTALFAPAVLRLSLALTFLWFGLLKVAGDSPVTALVSATLPWGQPTMVVRLLGIVEVGLGLGLLVGRAQRLLLLAVATHLAGTFLTFVMAPGMTMRHGDPFLLTADGEFVLKNLVLISAAVLLASQRPSSRRPLAVLGVDNANAAS